MGSVTDILAPQQLHDLWGAGYTVTLRPRDPYEIDLRLIPRGVSYQWNPIDSDPRVALPAGWYPVPYSRHEGVFAPWGTEGYIERGGLRLCEKPAEVVQQERERQKNVAEEQSSDWAARVKDLGISGKVKVDDVVRDVGDNPGAYKRETVKTIETTVKIPRDMTPYIDRIFAERDRLEAEVVRPDRTLSPGPVADAFVLALEANERDGTDFQWWPTLRAILLPIAVDNVRKSLKETPHE